MNAVAIVGHPNCRASDAAAPLDVASLAAVVDTATVRLPPA